MEYKELKEKAEIKNKTLQENDFKIESTVKIEHNDGSILKFTHAIVEMFDGVMVIYTEHHGYFVYHTHDLVSMEHNFDDRDKKVQSTRS